MSIFWLKSTTRRVCLSSPPRRTSLATGKSPTARVCGAAATGHPAIQGMPKRKVPTTTAVTVARKDIDVPEPLSLLSYFIDGSWLTGT